MKNAYFLTALIALLLSLNPTNIHAQLSEEELAKIAQNPLANLMSLPIQNSFNTGIGPKDRTQYIMNFQPVIPFAEGKIITRTVVPLVNQPNILDESGSTTGFSDITFSAFYTTSIGEVNIGLGPVLNFPTAKEGLGAGEWGVGPTMVVVVKPGNFVMGALINNIWSIQNDDINQMLIQLFINYNFENGTYLTTAPAITSNWNASPDNRWTVPLGLGAGKIVKLGGKIPLNVQAGAYYNVEKPRFLGSDWSFKLGATLLLPTAMFKKNRN